MRRKLAAWVGLWMVPLISLASEGPTTALEHRVKTANLRGGNLLLANLYNDNRLLYAIGTTVAMATLGIVIAFGVDLVLGKLGLKVSKVEHRE